MAIVPQQGLPFVIESPFPVRVQRWASYAGQTATREEFNQISYAFTAFWFEEQAAREYQFVLDCFQIGLMPQAVSWLDMLVASLEHVANYWLSVVHLMDGDGEQQVPASLQSWYRDAGDRIQEAMSLRQTVAQLVLHWCEQYQLLLPEHTQAYFTELQSKGL